jgi:hypothetical protein
MKKYLFAIALAACVLPACSQMKMGGRRGQERGHRQRRRRQCGQCQRQPGALRLALRHPGGQRGPNRQLVLLAGPLRHPVDGAGAAPAGPAE